jgi:RTX calcium-binding nonapeptide repeat (4 copies)/Putative metal-binding motif
MRRIALGLTLLGCLLVPALAWAIPQPVVTGSASEIHYSGWVGNDDVVFAPANDGITLVNVTSTGAEVMQPYGNCTGFGTSTCTPSSTPTITADLDTGTNDKLVVEGAMPADISGGPGIDTIVGGTAADNLLGDEDNDSLSGRQGNDGLSGGAGDDQLDGGDGDDQLNGDAGADTINGGDGDDTVPARDGAQDRIDCGPGANDKATVDTNDLVANCEQVDRPTVIDDADGDGYAPPADCNDSSGNVNPAADEIADDGIDQNCDGHDAVTPPDVETTFKVSKAGTLVSKLTAVNLVDGTVIKLSCSGKNKGCPFKLRKSTASSSTKKLAGSFGKRRVKPGAVIEVRLQPPGDTARVVRFQVRKGKQPKRTQVCIPAGATAGEPCPG